MPLDDTTQRQVSTVGPERGDSGQPHPAYGPCDGMGPNGQCSVCCGITDGELARLRAAGNETLGGLVIQLQEYLAASREPQQTNTPLERVYQSSDTREPQPTEPK